MNPVGERFTRLDRDRLLSDDRPAVDSLVDVMHGHTCHRDSSREGILDRAGAGEVGEQRWMDIHDAVRKTVEERRGEQVHVSSEHDEVDTTKSEPIRNVAITRVPVAIARELEDAHRDSGLFRALERAYAALVAGDARNREAAVDQRLEIRPFAADEDADHVRSIAPITSACDGASGTTAQNPIPRLKTRRSSSSSTPCSASHWKTAGRSQESHSMCASRPGDKTRERLPRMPPPVTCASARTSATARSSRTGST